MSVSHAVVVSLLVCVSACAALAASGSTLLKADFESDPRKAGWRTGADRGEAKGAWAKPTADSRGRFLVAEKGYWEGPPLAVSPFAYYRLRFRSRGQAEGYWAAFFHDADGNQLDADHYDSLPGSRRWQQHECCVRANVDAKTVRLRFIARRGPVRVDDVSLERVDSAAVAEWADRVCATLPPVEYTPPPARWKLLPKTMSKLRRGPSVRIVLLGDSIANDTANSAFDALLERAYPKCRVELVNSVRGGTGCGYYRKEDRIRKYVLPFKPDLLVIAGISHGYNVENIRDVIRQVRARSDCEIMVMTGAICPRVHCEIYFAENGDRPRDEACEILEHYPAAIVAMAAEEKAELLDVRAAWDQYVQKSPRPQTWFMRDAIHANTRGKQVVGRIVLHYFQPRGR